MSFIVYWLSAFNGKNPGSYTPVIQPNFAVFDDSEKAAKHVSKLTLIKDAKGTYRGRVVTHVSGVCQS